MVHSDTFPEYIWVGNTQQLPLTGMAVIWLEWMWLGESILRTNHLFHKDSRAWVRITIGLICVVSIILWNLKYDSVVKWVSLMTKMSIMFCCRNGFLFYFLLLFSTRVLPFRYTTGVFTEFYSEFLQWCLWCTWRVSSDLFSLGVFLVFLGDASEEVCDADGVYVKLQNQGWGERFEDCRAVFWP